MPDFTVNVNVAVTVEADTLEEAQTFAVELVHKVMTEAGLTIVEQEETKENAE